MVLQGLQVWQQNVILGVGAKQNIFRVKTSSTLGKRAICHFFARGSSQLFYQVSVYTRSGTLILIYALASRIVVVDDCLNYFWYVKRFFLVF